jgi:hypothetical protein
MSIQDLGSIGELVAAIATIVTLLYLATQLRQNTRSVRTANTTSHFSAANAVALVLGQDAELTQLYFTGLQEPAVLSPMQRNQFDMLLGAYLLTIQQGFLLGREGVFDKEIRSHQESTLTWVVNAPGFHVYWENWGKHNPPAFIEYVESFMENGAVDS